MLTEQRHEIILNLLKEKNSITVSEAKEILHASESTIRRDINTLHNAGKLTKVFGGAVAIQNDVVAYEPTVAQKMEKNKDEKIRIAKYAASLIKNDDFVYLDAGTTTGYMIDYITSKEATFVTNAVAHAKKIAFRGNRVILIEGELKGSTEAIVGNYAVDSLRKYHFTMGFFGANGITEKAGFTTPDANEALVKKMALSQCKEKYILADSSKFNSISPVTFSGIDNATIITGKKLEAYDSFDNILVI